MEPNDSAFSALRGLLNRYEYAKERQAELKRAIERLKNPGMKTHDNPLGQQQRPVVKLGTFEQEISQDAFMRLLDARITEDELALANLVAMVERAQAAIT